MAIYHCNIQIIGKAQGRSAVAASAYRSGTKIKDLITGLVHDYGRKGGVVYTEVMLPEHAPEDHADRETLWNSVQAVEKNKNAQLAREVEVALPKELTRDQQIEVVRKYVRKNFVDKGMVADIAIHDKGDGNPHSHIMLTTRGYKDDGSWAPKEKKAYKLDEKGERIPVIDKKTGQQKIGPKGRKMWQRESVAVNSWNDRGNAEIWRASWAEECNKFLATENHIDHRSYARQGLDKVPTVHEGPAARQMEKRGEVSDRCQENREIRQENAAIEEQKSVIKALLDELEQLKKRLQALISATKARLTAPFEHMLARLKKGREQEKVASEAEAREQAEAKPQPKTMQVLYAEMERNLARMIGEDRTDYTLVSAERLWREYARKRGSSPAAKPAADQAQEPQPYQRPKKVDRRAAIFAAKYGKDTVVEPVQSPSVADTVAQMQPETVPDTVAQPEPKRQQEWKRPQEQPEKLQRTNVVLDAVPSTSAEDQWWVPESVADTVADTVAEPVADMVAQSVRERDLEHLERNLERKDREKRQQIRTSQPNRGRLQVQFNRKKYSPAMQDVLDEIHANDPDYTDSKNYAYEPKADLRYNPRSSQEFEDLMNSIEVDTTDDYGFDF